MIYHAVAGKYRKKNKYTISFIGKKNIKSNNGDYPRYKKTLIFYSKYLLILINLTLTNFVCPDDNAIGYSFSWQQLNNINI